MKMIPLESAGLLWLKIRKKCSIVCTEFGTFFRADVAGIFCSEWIEIEIKRTKQDLLRDKLKPSHKRNNIHYGPNYFYFLVPESLEKEAVVEAKNINTKYGVMILKTGESVPNVVKRARKLHNECLTDWYKKLFYERVGWDIARTWQNLQTDMIINNGT